MQRSVIIIDTLQTTSISHCGPTIWQHGSCQTRFMPRAVM